MTILICLAAYLAIGAALARYWNRQSEPVDRAPTSLVVASAVFWPGVLVLMLAAKALDR